MFLNYFFKLRTLIHLFVLLSALSLEAQVWQRECPDSTGLDKADYCDLIIDNQNVPHIAYYDEDFQDLRYAVQNNSKWSIKVIDSSETRGLFSSIALDLNENPVISYQGYILYVHTALFCARNTDEEWIIDIVDSSKGTGHGNVGDYSSVAVNKAGEIGISYKQSNPNQIKFAHFNGSYWSTQKVTDVIESYYTKMFYLSDSTAVIVYHELISGEHFIKAAFLQPGETEWQVSQEILQIRPIGYTGDAIDCDIDIDDNIYLVYKNNIDIIILAKFNWTNWSIDELYELDGSQRGIAVKIDRDNKPAVVIIDDKFQFFRYDGSNWTNQLVDDYVTGISNPDIDFDSFNYPSVIVQARTPTYSRYSLFYYKYWSGQSQIVTPATAYDFGNVWTQSYADWYCTLRNSGNAPLEIKSLSISSALPNFQVTETTTPLYLAPYDSALITVRFDPYEAKNYIDTLNIFSNDPVNNDLKIVLSGTGIDSGNTGNLTLDMRNVYYESDYGLFKADIPLQNSVINLIGPNQTNYGPYNSGNTGIVNIQDLPLGQYEIRVMKTINVLKNTEQKELLKKAFIYVGPGINTFTMLFPGSLFQYKYDLIDSLTNLRKEFEAIPFNYTYISSEEGVKDLLSRWGENIPNNLNETIGRLILVEEVLKELFEDSYNLGSTAGSCLGDLVAFAFYSQQWMDLGDIINLLISSISNLGQREALMKMFEILIKEIIKYAIIELVSEGLEQAVSAVPPPGDQLIIVIWTDIKEKYFYDYINLFPTHGITFSTDNWNNTRQTVFKLLEQGFFQLVYIELLTGPELEKAEQHSENFEYNGTIEEAFEEKVDNVASKIDRIQQQNSIASDLRTAGKLLMMTSLFIDQFNSFMSALPTVKEVLDWISLGLQAAAYISVGSGLAVSAAEFFDIDNFLYETVDDIYFPLGKSPKSGSLLSIHSGSIRPGLYTDLKQAFVQSSSEYNSVLAAIKNDLSMNNNFDAAMRLEELREKEQDYKIALHSVGRPIYSVVNTAMDSLPGFQEQFDTLRSQYAYAGEDRLKVYLTTFLSAADNSDSVRILALQQVDKTMQNNSELTDIMTETLDIVTSSFQIPPVITQSFIYQEFDILKSGEAGRLNIRIKNVGSEEADSVYAKIFVSEGIDLIENDSVYIGNLSAGEESQTISWQMRAINDTINLGLWEISVLAQNCRDISFGKTFAIEIDTTGSEAENLSSEIPTEYGLHQNYPNPFNSSTVISYQLPAAGNVTLKVYDLLGNEITTLVNEYLQSGTYEMEFNLSHSASKDIRGLTSGVYFYQLKVETSANGKGFVDTKKMILLR